MSGPLRYLKNELGQDQSKIDAWFCHWVREGFDALEAMLRPGPYAYGTEVTLATSAWCRRSANARRLKVPLECLCKIITIDAACAGYRLRGSTAREPAGRGMTRTAGERPPRPAHSLPS